MKGAAALLIPGNMCDARMWRGGNDIIRNTLHGALGAEPVDIDTFRDATIAGMARRALAAVQGPVLPFGFSLGAIVAAEMAVLAPDRVKGLVLAGYNATADLPDRAAVRPLQQEEVRQGRLNRVLIEELKPNYLAKAKSDDAELLSLLFDMGAAAGPQVFIRQSEALRLRPDRVEALSGLNIPTLYIAGAEDALCPPAWHRRWSGLTPGAALAVLDAAGHMAPLEQPDLFASAVRRWLHHNTERLAA